MEFVRCGSPEAVRSLLISSERPSLEPNRSLCNQHRYICLGDYTRKIKERKEEGKEKKRKGKKTRWITGNGKKETQSNVTSGVNERDTLSKPQEKYDWQENQLYGLNLLPTRVYFSLFLYPSSWFWFIYFARFFSFSFFSVPFYLPLSGPPKRLSAARDDGKVTREREDKPWRDRSQKW